MKLSGRENPLRINFRRMGLELAASGVLAAVDYRKMPFHELLLWHLELCARRIREQDAIAQRKR